MKTSTHSIAAGVSTVAKLHWLRVLSTLKLFSVNHKNSPLPSLFLFPWFPGFLTTLIQRVTTVIVSTASTVYSMWLLDGYFCFPKFISVRLFISRDCRRIRPQNYSSVDFASFSRIIYKDITVNIFIRLHIYLRE